MDHTKKNTFAAFVNVDKNDKYWINGNWQNETDTPSLFKYNTSEEKKIVQEVAQSYIDNWGVDALEVVILEVKSRHITKLKKSTEAEKDAIRLEAQRKAASLRESDVVEVSVEKPKAKRGRPAKGATIST